MAPVIGSIYSTFNLNGEGGFRNNLFEVILADDKDVYLQKILICNDGWNLVTLENNYPIKTNIYMFSREDFDSGSLNIDGKTETLCHEIFDTIFTINKSIYPQHIQIYEEKICCACMEEKPTILGIPCGHKCLCNNCWSKLKGKKCPMCNIEIETTRRKVYDSCKSLQKYYNKKFVSSESAGDGVEA